MTSDTFGLLDDDELTELMAAEYAARGGTLDEVTRQRLWRRIEGRLSSDVAASPATGAQTSRGPLWVGPLLMTALVLLGLASFLVRPGSDDGVRLKGADTGLPVRLVAYRMLADGSLEPFAAAKAQAGDTLVFKTLSPQSGVVALAMSSDDGAPVSRFVGSAAHSGSEQLLEQGGRTYGYRLEAGEKATLRFCAVAETTTARLEALLTHLPSIFAKLASDACVVVPPPGGP